MGSVSPLLAVAKEIKKQRPEASFIWVGTRGGPEREVVAKAGIAFKPIFSGKWRRYVSVHNIVDVIFIALGFFQSLYFISRFKPAAIVSAGGFVSVPVVWAGWILRVPSLIHQQDLRSGLANRLMQPFAARVTVTFEEQLKFFSAKKTVWTGNPVRDEILHGHSEEATEIFKLEQGIPTVLVTGGGTGAEFLNELVLSALSELTKFCQIVHLTGRKKGNPSPCPLPQGERENKREEVPPPRLSSYGRGTPDSGRGGEGRFRNHSYEFFTTELMP